MRFGILGPLDIRTDDGTPVAPGGPRPRALPTLLLLDAGRPVSPQRLIDSLYGAEPPAGAASALHSQISPRSRRSPACAGASARRRPWRRSRPATAWPSRPTRSIIHRFETLVEQGGGLLAAGDSGRAGARLREALALWRGPALPDLPARRKRRPPPSSCAPTRRCESRGTASRGPPGRCPCRARSRRRWRR
ncbi:AfsR/SARP family transcriptional regulator [Streptomyces mexicanus]|uniref:AfsR/SARP family transcriptional regulator n=1 Tax=Streptomyces mexicanus TaxID=178566 RepID=UPI002E2A9786|nr:BTAD domain-containing putative transcriptional regulator [Streptomyces mexicanus]